MSWSINHAERVFNAINSPWNAHSLRFNGNTALLLNIHAVKEAVTHFTLLNDTAELQNSVGYRGLSMIDMCDNTEVTHQLLICRTWLIMSRHLRHYEFFLGLCC